LRLGFFIGGVVLSARKPVEIQTDGADLLHCGAADAATDESKEERKRELLILLGAKAR